MLQSDYFEYLGIYIDHSLTWSKHETYIQSRVYLKYLSCDSLLRMYKQAVLPLLCRMGWVQQGYLVQRSQRHCRALRDPTLLDLPLLKTKCGQTSFNFSAASAWNKLPREIRELRTLAQLKVRTFTLYLMNMDRANHICNINA